MRWKAGTIGGPTGGQIYNIFDILYDVGGKKYNHHTVPMVFVRENGMEKLIGGYTDLISYFDK